MQEVKLSESQAHHAINSCPTCPPGDESLYVADKELDGLDLDRATRL